MELNTISSCVSLEVHGMEYSDTVYLKDGERETKVDDIIMRDEAIFPPRVGWDYACEGRGRNA